MRKRTERPVFSKMCFRISSCLLGSLAKRAEESERPTGSLKEKPNEVKLVEETDVQMVRACTSKNFGC